uniref:Uncharacterized protein n=1 Tax=Salix viminalis TaxID=40686 RepID=A0A6N2LZ57_SALVM
MPDQNAWFLLIILASLSLLHVYDRIFGMLIMYALDPLTTLKARLNNAGKASALVQHEWRPKSFFTVSGEVDTKAIEKIATKRPEGWLLLFGQRSHGDASLFVLLVFKGHTMPSPYEFSESFAESKIKLSVSKGNQMMTIKGSYKSSKVVVPGIMSVDYSSFAHFSKTSLLGNTFRSLSTALKKTVELESEQWSSLHHASESSVFWTQMGHLKFVSAAYCLSATEFFSKHDNGSSGMRDKLLPKLAIAHMLNLECSVQDTNVSLEKNECEQKHLSHDVLEGLVLSGNTGVMIMFSTRLHEVFPSWPFDFPSSQSSEDIKSEFVCSSSHHQHERWFCVKRGVIMLTASVKPRSSGDIKAEFVCSSSLHKHKSWFCVKRGVIMLVDPAPNPVEEKENVFIDMVIYYYYGSLNYLMISINSSIKLSLYQVNNLLNVLVFPHKSPRFLKLFPQLSESHSQLSHSVSSSSAISLHKG